jgi:hypothetical protein
MKKKSTAGRANANRMQLKLAVQKVQMQKKRKPINNQPIL